MLARIKIKEKKYDEALKLLKKINALKPDDPLTLYQTGSIYYKKNNK